MSGLVITLAAVLALAGTAYLLGRARERGAARADALEQKDKAHETQRKMLDAAVNAPRTRDDLADRLHDGKF